MSVTQSAAMRLVADLTLRLVLQSEFILPSISEPPLPLIHHPTRTLSAASLHPPTRRPVPSAAIYYTFPCH